MAADIHQLQSLGRLRGEFDRRSQDQESRIIALERENSNLNFMNKQSISQLKKLERDYASQEKILRSIRKCAACRCLENRRKTSQPGEGGHAWDALLTQVATSTDGVANAPQNSNTTGSTGSRAASSTRAQPNPSDRSRREELTDEVLLLRNVNARLKSTIDQLQTDISRKSAQIDSLRRSTNANHGQSLAAKEREIEDLRKQVSELLQKNLEMATAASTQRSNQYYASADRALNEVQTTVRQFEQELVALRAERRELVESVAALRQDVTTKETSLKRCERLLTEADREKERLVAETRRLKRGDGRTRPTSQVTAPVNRSRSELDVNNAATGSRPNSRSSRSPFGGRRSANIYCPVCREMREELQALAPTTRAQSLSRSPVRTRAQQATSSPDSGFADRADKQSQAQLRRLKEQLNKEQMNNRLLEHERNGLKHLHEEATAEASRLRRELLNRNSRPSTSTDPPPDATDLSEGRWTSKLRADNDKLRRQLQTTKERLESENARRQANESLLAAQKTKVEQDYREALSRLDGAEAQVAALSRQLADREVSIEQLNAQLIHQLSRRPTDSPAVHGMQLREYDNLIADLTGKVRHAEAARTTADSKCAELRRQLEDAHAESSRLQVDVQSLRRELQHVSDSSGDLAEASTAQLKLQLRDKNMEISALRSKVHDLDQEYQKFESGLAEQQATLNRLQHNLSVTSSQKTDSEKRCAWLQEENSRLAGRINQLESDNSALRTELEAALVQQDYLNASAEKYISEIQSYQKLLSDKEAERAALRAKLQDANGQVRRTNSVGAERSSDGLATMEANLHDLQLQSVRDELESARAEQTKLVNERRTLEAHVNRCERELDAVRCELEAEREQKGSLHADLAAARQQLIAADNHVLELTAKLSHVETELQKARAQIDNLSADVELEKAKALSAAAAVSEVEKALVANREQHAHVTLDAQQRTTEVQMLRERIYDYEAKLELQGRDLIDTRSKLGQALKDVESLRRELSDERFERQRLQSRLNSNSQSSS